MNPGSNFGQVLASSHPLSVSAEKGAVSFFSSQGEVFLWVPAGTSEFAVRVYGQGLGEGVKATLVDSAGMVFEEVDNCAQLHQFEVTLPQPSKGEGWSLRLARPSKLFLEDFYVETRVIPPLLGLSREALLRPAN